jgi:TRAP-type C4-dicarboxylate transport system permease small subunit
LLSDLSAFLRQPANCFLLLLILVVIGLIVWVSWRLLVSVNENRNPPAVAEAEEIPPPADESTPPDEW